MKTNMINQRDKEGWRHGPWAVYYNNGQLLSKGEYIHRRAQGLWEYYWSNGNLWQKGEHKQGKNVGLWHKESYND